MKKGPQLENKDDFKCLLFLQKYQVKETVDADIMKTYRTLEICNDSLLGHLKIN